VEVVSLLDPTAPVVGTRWPMGGSVIDVKVHGWWLVVGLASGRLKVMDLGAGSTPTEIAEVGTWGKPLQSWVSGNRLHVAEVKSGVAWGLCAAGVRCAFGSEVEVFELDEVGGTLTALGRYGSETVRLPFTATAGDLIIEPKVVGFQAYRTAPRP
jgi:hypothetical protein